MFVFRRAVSVVLSAVFLVGCSRPVDPATAYENAVRSLKETDAAYSSQASQLTHNSKPDQMKTFLGFYVDRAVLLMPNVPLVQGTEGIRNAFNALMARPEFKMDFAERDIGVDHVSSVAFTSGTYLMFINTQKGTSDKWDYQAGSYRLLWHRESDGTWKIFEQTLTPNIHNPSPN